MHKRMHSEKPSEEVNSMMHLLEHNQRRISRMGKGQDTILSYEILRHRLNAIWVDQRKSFGNYKMKLQREQERDNFFDEWVADKAQMGWDEQSAQKHHQWKTEKSHEFN
eukprot:5288950-Amphidinium_carterae.1